jgi:hypothetical protein
MDSHRLSKEEKEVAIRRLNKETGWLIVKDELKRRIAQCERKLVDATFTSLDEVARLQGVHKELTTILNMFTRDN